MLRPLVFLAVLCVAAAAAVASSPAQRVYAEPRDGASHGGGSSSYSAPAHAPAAAPASSYSSGGNEQGNLYYYYYPVDDYGSTEAADAGFDIFTALILPLLILGGILLCLSSLSFTFTGRAMRESAESGIVDQLQTEVERIFYLYLNAFESEACVQRAVCQSGVYSKNIKNKDFYFSMAEPFIPEGMKGNMAIFRMAAKEGFDTGKCKKYRCSAPKIFN